MRTRRFILFVYIVILLFTTGCWDYKDYETLTLVSAMGYDMEEGSNEITVTIQYSIPGGSSGAQQQGGSSPKLPVSGVVKAKSYSMADAVTKIQETLGKRLFYGYLDVIVFNQTAAENIIEQVVGLSDRSPSIRTTAYFAITDGKAEDVLSTLDPTSPVTIGKHIHDLIDQATSSGSAFPVTIEDFLEKMVIGGIQPVVPKVMVTFKDKTEDKTSSEDDGPVKIVKLKEGYHKVDGMAVFTKEKFKGWLNADESAHLGWMLNENVYCYESVDLSGIKNLKDTLIFYISNAKVDLKAEVVNGNPVITVNTSVEADLRKYITHPEFYVLTPDVVTMLENELAKYVCDHMYSTVIKGQKELKTDIFGFGFALYRKDPSLWHSKYENIWDEIFPNIQVNINVNAKVINTGTNLQKISPK